MATPQIGRNPETHQIKLCNNLLTISTHHGICSDSWNVTVEKVAHRIWKWEKRDAIKKKRDRNVFLFFFFFLFSFLFSLFSFLSSFILIPRSAIVKGSCASFFSGTTCVGGVGVVC